MKLYTKSILEKALPTDGIRICIMRRIKPEFEFDMWLPHLAASTKILDEYQSNSISWETYEQYYKDTIIPENKTYFQIVLDILKKDTVTLLCVEDTTKKCHRRLAAQQLQEMDPSIELILC